MGKSNKKVICINGDDSKLYDQVIFIMKDGINNVNDNNKKPIDFVFEAEKIINAHINNDKNIKKQEITNVTTRTKDGIQQIVIKKSGKFDIILNIVMLVCCISLASIILMKFYI